MHLGKRRRRKRVRERAELVNWWAKERGLSSECLVCHHHHHHRSIIVESCPPSKQFSFKHFEVFHFCFQPSCQTQSALVRSDNCCLECRPPSLSNFVFPLPRKTWSMKISTTIVVFLNAAKPTFFLFWKKAKKIPIASFLNTTSSFDEVWWKLFLVVHLHSKITSSIIGLSLVVISIETGQIKLKTIEEWCY